MSASIHDRAPRAFDEPLALPTAAEPHRRAPLPLAALLLPAIGAVAMWLVTGSAGMLLFAALGPLMAAASFLDGLRAARRARRRSAAEATAARATVAAELARRHDRERSAAWARHPDVARVLERDVVWRNAGDAAMTLVVGAGEAPSDVRIVGGGDDPDAADLRRRAATLADAPVGAPAGLGICVVGPRAAGLAVARALVLQLCLRMPPDALAIVAAPRRETWIRRLPHRSDPRGAALRLAFTAPGEPVPDADIVVAAAVPSAPVPPRCAALLVLSGGDAARLDYEDTVRDVRIEGVSHGQADAIAGALAARAADVGGAGPPAVVPLRDVVRGPWDADGLAVALGLEDGEPALVDLVADGPHAVVAGVTGSGKSELLVTWVTALCATRTTADVSFLLADFKGGTAFDALRALPHVTGVLTDLDATGARRAIDSLRAELRRRERILADAGARDVCDPGVDLPRLVIVVDEFAAMLTDHPDLHAVFTDVAARGRALGMHLVLGTQRVSGVLRDALLANCPLRISLRVTEPADSRAVVGTDDAAQLPGTPQARGLALVRRGSDAAPRLVRIALTSPHDVAGAARAAADQPRPHRPWLSALPARLPLGHVLELDGAADSDGSRLIVGLADEPDRQRQTPVALTVGVDRGLVVVGGPGSGRTTAIDLLHSQASIPVIRIGPDPEVAWDAVLDLSERVPPGALVLIDDLDALVAAYPADYAAALVGHLERAIRLAAASAATVVLTVQRLGGPLARVAELIPRRAILPLPARIDHVAAGGDPQRFDASAPPGRADVAGVAVQFAYAEFAADPVLLAATAPVWEPEPAVSGIVARSPGLTAARLETARPEVQVIPLDRLAPAARIDDTAEGAVPRILVGDAEAWQRQWNLLTAVRSAHDLVVQRDCAPDLRVLTGRRELPPYAAPGSGRAWLLRGGRSPVRVTIPAEDDC